MAIGGDAFLYSKISDPSLHHALLADYPNPARTETAIQKKVSHWTRHADVVMTGFMVDGIGRWDITTPSYLSIDTASWESKSEYSTADGRNGKVIVVHSPNHRHFKGTAFLLDAVNRLREEGLSIELRILEGIPNTEVQRNLQEADILAEQFVWTGYAMSALEGMATGLPVMSNLEDRRITELFSRYAFLDTCPVYSTSPESLTDNLRILATNPQLRKELGIAGRKYVEKYHSYDAARFLFGAIYSKLFSNPDLSLIDLYASGRQNAGYKTSA